MGDLMEKLQTPAVRWSVICVLVAILLHFRLVLAAVALPVMAYWQQTSQRRSEEEEEEGIDQQEGALDFADEDDDGIPARGLPYGDDPVFGDDRQGADLDDMDLWKSDSFGGGDSFPSRANAPTRGKPQNRDQAFGAGKDDLDIDNIGADPLAGDDPWMSEKKDNCTPSDILGGMSFDFLGGGGGNDFDFDFLGGGKGKGKSNGKDKGKKGKSESGGPREADPRQVFVAGVGDLTEDEIRGFFEESGEVERLKVLTQPDGSSKGVCFVTFRTEEQAKEALDSNGAELQGRRLTIRLARGQGQGKDGGKDGGGKDAGGKDGGGKGGFGGGGRSRPFPFPDDVEPGSELGGNLRNGGRREDEDSRRNGSRRATDDDDTPSKGSRKGDGRGVAKGKGDVLEPRTEMDDLLEEALAEEDGPLQPTDFDAGSKRFLTELMNRDRAQGTGRSVDALDVVFKQTRNKTRESVHKWPAYVFTLLQKFDPDLHEELYLRDIEQRREREKAKALRGEAAPRKNDIQKAWDFVPEEGTDGTRQVLDRWGKPVLL